MCRSGLVGLRGAHSRVQVGAQCCTPGWWRPLAAAWRRATSLRWAGAAAGRRRALRGRFPASRASQDWGVQVRRLNDFRPTAGKRRGAPPRPSCETTASTPAAAREAPKFSSALRAVAVVAVVECRYTYVAAQLSSRKKVHVARKNAPGRLESARRCVSKDVALQVWGRIRHTGRFSRFYAGQR